MGGRRIAALAVSGALVAGGAGAAIAAVSKDEKGKVEDEILADAAKRLNVTPDKLRDALAAAQDDRLDNAVKEGDLTQKQADAIKAARKQSGIVLGGPGPLLFRGGPHPYPGPGAPGFGPGFGYGHGPHGLRMRAEILDGLADALGTTEAKLKQQLRDGKSIADIAKANGKSLDDVGEALKATAKTRIDEAVKDGDLTQKQADELLARADERIDALKSGKALLPRRQFFRGGKPPMPDMPKMRPGGLSPDDDPPELAPPDDFFG